MTIPLPSLHAPKTMLAHLVMAAAAKSQARLRATGDGCALLTMDDRVLFAASGPGARAACLRRAMEAGVMRIGR